jgi:predicted nucleic acid-binding protein
VALLEAHALADGLQLADALIAAAALAYGLPLATGNTQHFQAVVGLRIAPFVPAGAGRGA